MASLKADVRIFEDLAALSEAAAALFIGSVAEAALARGRALVALSGGGTPVQMYDLLATTPFTEQVDWPHLHVFWGDERCVPPEDLESNYRQAKDALLSRVPIPADNIHRIDGDAEPEAAAISYALALKRFASPPLAWPRFDCVLLGLGEDGHTASLFPRSEVEMIGPTASVTASYQGRPAKRVTLTPPVFNSARSILFLVSGAGKSETVAAVLHGDYRPDILPAQRIRPTDGQAIWLLDRAAAGGL